ncbi:hypothetical protein HYX08_04885 [Candidatus Woesearchaeota archaeon]|nr:hypothetical protein [Candidatus Woesearchaeota archaeon]
MEWEEQAKDALSETKEFLDIEGGIVKEEHLLAERLQALVHVSAHLDEIVDDPEANRILGQIAHLFHLLDRKLDRLKLRGLKIMKEERNVLDKISGYLSFREWRAAIHQIPEEESLQATSIRLHKRDLRWLFKKFNGIASLTGELLKIIPDTNVKGQAEFFIKQFGDIMKFYERLFWSLLLKERELHKKLKEKSKISS